MSTGVRVRTAEAAAIAADIVTRLRPACERIEIAGSIRRAATEVGDIELVAVSRQHTVPSGLLFEVDAIAWDLDERVNECVASGLFERLLREGPVHEAAPRRVAAAGRSVHRQAAGAVGRHLPHRTGPADYSRRFVTDIRTRGYHVREGALHRGRLGCGAIPCVVVDTPEEVDVYRTLGLPWVEPEHRA